MKSPWKVTSSPFGGKLMYAVIRILDTSAVDHTGNREYATDYRETREEAQAIADRLNAEGESM